jgi:hypothetical protein
MTQINTFEHVFRMQTPYAFGGCSDKTCQVRRIQRIAITNVSLAPYLTGLRVALNIVGASAFDDGTR